MTIFACLHQPYAMQRIPALCLFLSFFAVNGYTQVPDQPCTITVSISIGICIDSPCIPLFSYVSNGTPPYAYEWFNGSGEYTTYLNYPLQTPVDTCLTLKVTDANGCVALASVRYVFPYFPQFPSDSLTLSNDTLVVAAGGDNFDAGMRFKPVGQCLCIPIGQQVNGLSFL